MTGASAFENFASHENTGKAGVSNLVFFAQSIEGVFRPVSQGVFRLVRQYGYIRATGKVGIQTADYTADVVAGK